jgi:hypothetical protein
MEREGELGARARSPDVLDYGCGDGGLYLPERKFVLAGLEAVTAAEGWV